MNAQKIAEQLRSLASQIDAVPASDHKPSTPPFQLPPCAPGMQWHREDGWTAEDLPQGYRPLVEGEKEHDGDEYFSNVYNEWMPTPDVGMIVRTRFKVRTRRPLTFTHLGKTWTYHRPGDPMPRDGKRIVQVVFNDNTCSNSYHQGSSWSWSETGGADDIIGWRYADEPKTQVPLGPEDVPPGSILKANSWDSHEWRSVDHVYSDGALLSNCPRTHRWGELMRDYQINRSLPLTGKWNPDAWEPCHKQP